MNFPAIGAPLWMDGKQIVVWCAICGGVRNFDLQTSKPLCGWKLPALTKHNKTAACKSCPSITRKISW